jgi:hypothetical protein
MIKFYRATQPSRKRDRGRFILQIGKLMFHLTRAEASKLTYRMGHVLFKWNV